MSWRLLPILLALAACMTAPARAETPEAACARLGTDDTLRPIPDSLVPAVNAAFGLNLPASVAVATTVYRCDGGHVWVCNAGANLVCGKANASTVPGPGEVAWCRDNPDAGFIPAVATGHDTIYEWRCHAGAPQIGRKLLDADERGFIAQNWRALP